MFRHLRPVRFADVDAARIVFFARVPEYCHDALEALFAGLSGGYPALTMGRDVGIPTVRLEVDFRAPLRYGDVAAVEVTVLALGRSSATFAHRITREADGVLCAEVRHVVVFCSLTAMQSVEIPADARALLETYRAGESA